MAHLKKEHPLNAILPPAKGATAQLPDPILPLSEVQSRESRGLPPVELVLRDESDTRELFQRLYGVKATNCRTLARTDSNEPAKSIGSIVDEAQKAAEKEYSRAIAGKKGAELLMLRFSKKAAAEKFLLKRYGADDGSGKVSLPVELAEALDLKYDRKVPSNLASRRAAVEMFGEKAGLKSENLPIILEQIEGYSGAKRKLLIDDYRAVAVGAGICAAGAEIGAGLPRAKAVLTNPLKKASYSVLTAKGVRVDEK